MAGDDKIYRSIVFLVAYDSNGEVIEETDMSFDDYYEGSPPLIDDDEYRSGRGIQRVRGRIYDSAGELQQEFESFYNELGEYQKGRAIHQDGTVTEN